MPVDQPKKVLIVDDHAIVRRGLRQLIDGEPGLTTCAEAEDAAQALALIERTRPHIVLVDLALKGTNGLDLTRQIVSHYSSTPVLVVSMQDHTLYADRALQAGARGYVTKRAEDDEIVRAIWTVLAGKRYFERATLDRIETRASAEAHGSSIPVEQLSDRELEVFLFIGRGYPPREIAEELHLSVKTVEAYRQRLKDKLGLESATHLSRFAVQWRNDQGLS